LKAVLASRNVHKARELERLLPGWEIEALDADDYPPETGATYYDISRAGGRRATCGCSARIPASRSRAWTVDRA
jgi:inosine/xanthosine triphosphate pyrophosphatase family protein